MSSPISTRWIHIAACACFVALTVGCRTTSHAEGGALAGAGLGGTLGALIGSQSGHGGSGALMGAMAGAMVGGLAGEAEDAREERDAAVAQAQYERDVAVRNSVTNYDLINMAQSGLSDQVILNAVDTRGGQFDLSPSAIIELKNHGVSESVILSIQKQSSSRSWSRYSRPTTIVAPAAPVYVVRPRPTYGIFIGSRPHYHHRPHYHYGCGW